MQTTDKVKPHILADSKLKEQLLDDLIKEYDIDEKIIEENRELFKNYANIKFELFLYGATIPYDKLEYYRTLQAEETIFFIHLHDILTEK